MYVFTRAITTFSYTRAQSPRRRRVFCAFVRVPLSPPLRGPLGAYARRRRTGEVLRWYTRAPQTPRRRGCVAWCRRARVTYDFTLRDSARIASYDATCEISGFDGAINHAPPRSNRCFVLRPTRQPVPAARRKLRPGTTVIRRLAFIFTRFTCDVIFFARADFRADPTRSRRNDKNFLWFSDGNDGVFITSCLNNVSRNKTFSTRWRRVDDRGRRWWSMMWFSSAVTIL